MSGANLESAQPSSPVSYDSSSLSAPNKRRRIALACNSCRTRKSRCDGSRPRCSTCKDLGFECEYQPSDSSTNVMVRKEYLSDLESRVKNVEGYLEKLSFLADSNPAALREVYASQRSPSREESQPFQSFQYHAKPHNNFHDRRVSINGTDPPEPASNDDLTDGMGAIVLTDEEDSSFFGASSNITFTRHISHAIAGINKRNDLCAPNPRDERRQIDGGVINVSMVPSAMSTSWNTKPHAKQQVNIFVLPPELETRELIMRYLSNTGLLFPYLHEGTFLDTYTQMKNDNFSRVRRTWLGLLNMVLALATSTNVEAEISADERTAVSDVYYQRAMQLCEKQLMRGTSLEVGTQRSVQTYATHGLAVKAAMSLGLHSSEASKRYPPLEQEVRKRTWYGCVFMDRNLSMTFGRPAAIPNEYVKLDLPAPLDGDNSSFSDPDSVSFFNATMGLYTIMGKVINSLYGGNIGCGGPPAEIDVATWILKIEQDLLEWQQCLPSNMRLQSCGDAAKGGAYTPALDRYRNILALRYHNVRVLLHRPILVNFLDVSDDQRKGPAASACSQYIGFNSLRICVQSSEEIILMVHTIVTATVPNVSVQKNRLGAWWFSLYYTFNAALVLFGSLLVRDRDNAVRSLVANSAGRWRDFIGMAIEALAKLDVGNRMVEKCRGYLERLVQMLDSLGSFGQPRSTEILAGSNLSNAEQGIANVSQSAGSNSLESQDIFSNFEMLGQSPYNLDLAEFMEGYLDLSQFGTFEEVGVGAEVGPNG